MRPFGSSGSTQGQRNCFATRRTFFSRDGVLQLFIVFLTLLAFGSFAKADTVNVGVLSFNVLIPGAPGSPGINFFNVTNASGSFSLPADFPVVDDLTFATASLSLTESGATTVIDMGDIAPGFFSPSSLLFLDTQDFTEAVFQATLSKTTFLLSDGSAFQATASTLSADLLPSSGPDLMPDLDSVLITVDGSIVANSVPEPMSGVFCLAGMVGVLGLKLPLRRRFS